MKQQKIYMKAWLDAHGRAKAVDTDEWYLDFANQLLPLVADSFIYGGREWEEDQKRVALTCALYLEDCVADGGNWRQFIHWHRKSYGRYLPFYALTEEYLPDEINREDIVLQHIHIGENVMIDSLKNILYLAFGVGNLKGVVNVSVSEWFGGNYFLCELELVQDV